MSTRRVAAIDCGTNTLRLLVTDLDPATGRATEVDRRTTIVRLGQDVDRTGVFAAAALQRTFTCLEQYADVLGHLDVDAIRMVATSAARDVANRAEFTAGVRQRVGVEPEVITGDEEARLSYDGVTRELWRAGQVAEPVVVVDIGGGSTELVMRPTPDAAVRGRSLAVGSVRLHERHLHSDPPTADEIAATEADLDTALATVDLPLSAAGTLVGVAGTVTTMAAFVLDLPGYDRDRVSHARLPRGAVLTAVEEIVAMTVAQRRALPFMQPDRADVIGAGALVLAAVLRQVDVPELLVSTHDILHGIAWSLVRPTPPRSSS